MSNSSIWPYQVLPLQARGPGNDGNKEVLCIPQSSSITGASPSDCLMSYLGLLFGRVLVFCRDAVGIFYSSIQLGQYIYICMCVCVYVYIYIMWVKMDMVILISIFILNLKFLFVIFSLIIYLKKKDKVLFSQS